MAEIRLGDDGQRVLREAERICYQTNVAITAPEHLLAAALAILARQERPGLPTDTQLQEAVLAVHGRSDEELGSQVMWGSAAREALNLTARAVAEAGETTIDARRLALGLIASGEINPMFYMTAGSSKAALLEALKD
jgi:hypothetical protein